MWLFIQNSHVSERAVFYLAAPFLSVVTSYNPSNGTLPHLPVRPTVSGSVSFPGENKRRTGQRGKWETGAQRQKARCLGKGGRRPGAEETAGHSGLQELAPSAAARPCAGEAQARLGNLSVLSEMSAEINLANPPRWPVTLISLKFQAD